MATTKELLEKAMLKIGSASTQPTGSRIDLACDQTSTSYQDYTPPCDGFIEMNGESAKLGNYLWVWNVKDLTRSATFAVGGNLSNVLTVPVKKGVTARCQFAGPFTQRTLTFIKSVGGGLGFLRKLFGVVEVQYGYA